jgi:serine protease inhibitor
MNRTAPSGALLTAIALLGLPACDTVFSPAPGGEAWTKVELDERLTHAYTGFGFDLFRELRAENPEGNVFASPTSAAFALAMTYNGATGQTAEEMAIALGIKGMTRDEVNAANRAWIDALADTQDRRAELAIANSIWYRSDRRVRDDFTQRTRDYYDAEVREMTTAEVINAWVEKHTNGRIDEIVQPPIPGDVVAYLINALYFKADWMHQFDERETRDAPFTRPDGSTVTVPMMWQRDAELPVRMGRVDESFDMVRLPYGNGRFSMVLALPRSDASLADVAKTLEPRSWTGWMDEFVDHEIAVALPRFEIEWESSLKTSLQALGMEVPFEAGLADFSQMFEGGGPWIDDVFQKTFLRVDEEGTEAAAVTKVVMVESAPPSLVFDRPFFLAIYDHATETVLFLGQITDPTG